MRQCLLAVSLLVVACTGTPVHTQISDTVPGTVTSFPMEFDMEAFVASLFDTVFAGEVEVAMVALVPERSQAQVEGVVFATLTEVEGYSFVSAEEAADAAAAHARREGTRPLEEAYLAYGLIPQFADTSLAQWDQTFAAVPGAATSLREVEEKVLKLPSGWEVIAEVSYRLSSGAIVRILDRAVVVAQWDSTAIIDSSGAISELGEPPLGVSHGCCGGTQGVAAGDGFVLLHESSQDAFVLDLESESWRDVDPRPSTGYVLGSAVIEGQLIIVNAAPRPMGPVTSETVSEVSALDLSTGTWENLGPVPEPISVGGVADNGARVFVAGTAQGPNNNILGSANPRVFQFTDVSGWEPLPPLPIHGQASTVGWAEGAGLLGWNYNLDATLLDESGEWHDVGPVPMDSAECYPRSEPVVGGVVGFCGGIAYFETATETWHPIPIYHGVSSWYGTTDTNVIGLVQTARGEALLIEYALPIGG